MKITKKMISNILALSIIAALSAQIFHEIAHGVLAVLLGAQWQALNLFAALWQWPQEQKVLETMIIEGGPAIVNIVTGILGVFLFKTSISKNHPFRGLFWLYWTGYSLFMGFGYLFVDPLLYQPGVDQVGDWQKVISLLGGGIALRISLIIIGSIGLIIGFFWVAKATMHFFETIDDLSHRKQISFVVLLVPYLVISSVFTVLGFWHPLGPEGAFAVGFQYWFGTIGMFWGFFLAGQWLDIKKPSPHPVQLPSNSKPILWVSAIGYMTIAIAVLLPSVWFG